jgi:pyruvyl transferase EpsO
MESSGLHRTVNDMVGVYVAYGWFFFRPFLFEWASLYCLRHRKNASSTCNLPNRETMKNSYKIHQELMGSLKNGHREILKLINGERVHLLDIPVYGNVGDLLILKGTEKFLKDNKVRVAGISSIHNFRDDIQPGDVILFQGGGNFGDLYPVHQLHRESVIAKYRNNRVIVLPQSIHFESAEAFDACAAALQLHPDLHILVRDVGSFKSALRMTGNCHLMPDMAHQLYSPKVRPAQNGLRLLFQRQDKESSARKVEMTWDTKTDWDLLIAAEMETICFFRRQLERFFRFKMDWLVMRLWLVYKNRLIAKAEKFFLEHDFVITDRLHGHILASLLNIPNCVMDNSYGKNSGYVQAWTKPSPLVSMDDSAEQTPQVLSHSCN